LTAADALCRAGVSVDLYEKEPELGGLAARGSLDGLSLDRYYHFICGGDGHLVELCAQVGLPIEWKPTRTSFFYEGRLYPFGSARHLLAFSPLTWGDRYRQARMLLGCYPDRDWRELDDLSAEEWLIGQVGEKAYRVIWYPLLKVKFGERYREISAAWLWHRVHRLLTSRRHVLAQERLGYMYGGAGELIARLAQRIRSAGGSIYPKTPVGGIVRQASGRLQVQTERGEREYESVICAIPAPLAAGLLADDPAAAGLARVEYIAVVCVLLILDRPVTDSFWINTNDHRIAFNGFIEFSNLNPAVANGKHLLYFPYYCHPSDPQFGKSDEALLEEYTEALRLIRPGLSGANVIQGRVHRDLHAQPVCPCGFSKVIPPFQGPLPGIFVLESSQLYPADRNLSGAIGLAKQVAELAAASLR